MDNASNKICARFNSKSTWVTLWAIALICLIGSLRALSLIKPKTCIALCIVALVFSALGTLMGIYSKKVRLFADDTFIYCTTLFGNEKCLPFDSVTGIKTGIFGSICIYSASFRIKCRFVADKNEFAEEIKKRI